MQVKTVGVVTILGASVMWAIEPVVTRLSYENSNFIHTSAIRSFVITVMALIYAIAINGSTLLIKRNKIPPLLYIAIGGTLCADLLYYYALSHVLVLNAVLVAHIQPLFVILIAFFMLKEEKLKRIDYISIVCMIGAGILVTTRTMERLKGFEFGTVGDALVLCSTFIWATTAITVKKYLEPLHAGVITFYRFLISSTFFLMFLLATSSLFLSNGYQIIVGLVVGAGTLLYYEGLKRMKVAQVSSLELSSPFFAAALGFFAFGEGVTLMQAGGMFLLILGIFLLSKK